MDNRLLFVFITIFATVYSEKGSSCTTPDNKDGRCVSIYDCKFIIDSLKQKNTTIIDFAKKSKCGFYDLPWVCCEYEEITPSSNASLFLPDTKVCGISVFDRLLGGLLPQKGLYPWIVALEYWSKKNNRSAGIKCAGSLINDRYILTAAGCLLHKEFKLTNVRLGEWNLTSDPDCDEYYRGEEECADPVLTVNISKIIIHPHFNETTRDNDIGLIRLDAIVKYTDYIRPVCLPSPKGSSINESLYYQTTGWGTRKTSVTLLDESIVVISSDECEGKFPNITLDANKFCGKNRQTYSVCAGDIGSPLMRTVTDRIYNYQLEGISSVSAAYCLEYPTLYTRVSNYMPWILEIISEE